MNILITGTGGFVGSSLYNYLEAHTNWVVFGIGHSGGPFVDHAIDITDSKAIEELYYIFPPIDVLIHTAAISRPADCDKDKTKCRDVNVHATSKLARTFPHSKFVLFSTYAVYGGECGDSTEDTPVDTVHEYGRTKVKAEAEVRKYARDHLILRPSVIYGSDMQHVNYFSSTVKTLESGHVMMSAEDQFFNPIYIDDLCEIVMRAIQMDKKGTFNVGSNESTSKYQFTESILIGLGYDAGKLVGTSGDDADGVKRVKNATIDSSKIQKELNYSIPPLSVSLNRCIAEYLISRGKQEV